MNLDPATRPLTWRVVTILIAWSILLPHLLGEPYKAALALFAVAMAHWLGYLLGETVELQNTIERNQRFLRHLRHWERRHEDNQENDH